MVDWSKRRAALVAAALMMAVATGGWAGCGRKEPPPNTPDAVEPSNESLRPEAEAPQAGSSSTGVIEMAAEPAAADAGSLPAEPTAPSPATRDQAEPVLPFEPLADASVGEWALYTGLHSRQVRYRITRVAAASVLTQVEVFENGQPVGLPTMREDLRTWDPVASLARGVQASRKAERVSVEAAGRSWQAVVYEDRWIEEGVAYVRRTWVSPEIPVFGTILMELYGDGVLEARLELTASGRSDEAGPESAAEAAGQGF